MILSELLGGLMLVVLSCLTAFAQQEQTNASPNGGDRAAYYSADVADAARKFVELTPDAQRAELVFAFDSPARTSGRDTSQTKSFCAILQWCPVSWGLTVCSMSVPQREALHTLLNRALSPGGYQTLVTILNRNRIIGEMEEVGDGTIIGKVLKSDPNLGGAETVFAYEKFAPNASTKWYPVVGGAKTFIETGTVVDWTWAAPPGLKARYKQFCDYAIALFGTPGGDQWGLRFEGHHVTVNLTFQKNEDGQVEVHATPLFFGAFPMIVPEDPYEADEIASQWHWTKGQVLMLGLMHHLREFWESVPDEARKSAFIGSDLIEQAKPLLLDTPPSSLVAALAPEIDQQAIEPYPHVTIAANELGQKALWHLRQAFLLYTGAMHPDIGLDYIRRFDQAVDENQTLTIAWAGGELEAIGSHHYTYAVIDDLLLEVLQSNQYTVQHDPSYSGNHLHTMLRDLSFDWDDPMLRHQQSDHAMPHQ